MPVWSGAPNLAALGFDSRTVQLVATRRVYGRSVQFHQQRSVVRSEFAVQSRKLGVLLYVAKQ